jgi:hypothetical protein
MTSCVRGHIRSLCGMISLGLLSRAVQLQGCSRSWLVCIHLVYSECCFPRHSDIGDLVYIEQKKI